MRAGFAVEMPRSLLIAVLTCWLASLLHLAHYTLTSMSAHTAAMNLTIGLEVAAAALLLAATLKRVWEMR